MTLPARFRPSDETWRQIEADAGFDELTPRERQEITQVANVYLQAMSEYWGGIEGARLRKHNLALKKSLDRIIADLSDEGTPLERAVKYAYRAQLSAAIRAFKDDDDILVENIAAATDTLAVLRSAMDRVDRQIEKPIWEFARTPPEAFEMFAQNMEAFYERKVGPATVRKDFDAYGIASGFVHFVLAIWLALPSMNRRTRTAGTMSSRLAEVLMPPEKSRDRSQT